MTVLVDEIQKNKAIARSTADAPEIDGVVYVSNVKNVKPGEFIEVEVTGADAHDLRAKRLREPGLIQLFHPCGCFSMWCDRLGSLPASGRDSGMT